MQPEPEPEQAPAVARLRSGTGATTATVKTKRGVVFREGIERDSAKTGTAKQGTAIDVLSLQRTATGTLRAETAQGWTTATTREGKELLAAAACSELARASSWEDAQPLRLRRDRAPAATADNDDAPADAPAAAPPSADSTLQPVAEEAAAQTTESAVSSALRRVEEVSQAGKDLEATFAEFNRLAGQLGFTGGGGSGGGADPQAKIAKDSKRQRAAEDALGTGAPALLSAHLNSDFEVRTWGMRTLKGQPYDVWRRQTVPTNLPKKQLGTRHKPLPLRDVVYLQPLGSFDKSCSPDLEALRAHCAAFFHGLRVELMEPIGEESKEYKALRRVCGGIGARSVFDLLFKKLPADGFCIAAITMELLIQ